jgi:hypothetical protein
MKKIIIFILFFSSLASAQVQLSPAAKFGLVNVSTGSEHDQIYQIWGHTVLHLKDSLNGINECYDYGTFNFNQPNFIGKFLQGTLPYQMTIVDFERLVDHYRNNENRSVTERTLNLNAAQKQKLYDFLIENYKPENREYKYRFFYYNCASRLRDILEQICGKDILFDANLNKDKSYRAWIHEYAKDKMPWTDLGMSLAIGLPADKITGEKGAMFLPENLAAGFEQAKILQNGVKQPLVVENNLLAYTEPPILHKKIFTPFVIISIFAIIGGLLTFYQFRKQINNYLFDRVLFFILGLMGFFILGLWFLTDHGVTSNNLNVIWAFPLLLIVAFSLKNKAISKPLLGIYFIINVLLLLAWKFLPQDIPSPIIPLVILVLLRVLYIFKTQKWL